LPVSQDCGGSVLGNTEVYNSVSYSPRRYAIPVTFSESGTINCITIYHNGGTGKVLTGVYADNTGAPSSLLGRTTSTTISSVEGWQTISLVIPAEVQKGQTVWLSWVFENNPGVRETVGTPKKAYSNETWINGMPDSFGQAYFANYKYSVYCNYTPRNEDSNIGNTDIYGNTIKWGAQLAMPVTFTESGEITSVSIYHDGGTGNMLLGVYSDQGGFPSSRLGITASTLVSASAGWQTIQLSTPVPVVTGQKVWLSWVFQTAPVIRYTSGTPGRAASSNNWANQMPSAFGTSTIAPNKYSIYCTYTTQGSQPDVIAPVVTAFSIPATSSTLTVPVSSFTATDNKAVTGYLVTESATAPLAGDAGWSATAPASYVFVTAGTKTLYAWAKDAAGNISASLSDQVIITLPENDLGNTDIYGNTIKWGAQLAMPVTFTESGEITSVSIYHDGGTGNMLLGVYSDQGGFPSSRLGITASTLVSASAGWQTIQLSTPVPVVTGQKVWLSWVFQNTPAIRYTSGTPGRAASSNNWANQMPTAFGSSTIAPNKYSIYCTYTTQGSQPDVIAPVVTAFSIPATSSTLTVPVSSFTATDNKAVTGYLVTESATAPLAGDAGWSATAPASYVFVTAGTKTLYAWAKDAAGNVSASLSDQVIITLPENDLGNTDIYGNTIKWGAQLAMPVTFTESGEITSVSIYHDGGSGNMLLGVYSDQGGFPSSRLGITASTLVSASAGWQTIQLSTPVPVVTGQKVWLSWVFQNTPFVRYTAGTPGRAASSNNWANQMPSVFGASTIASNKYSIYCTYTVNTKSAEIATAIAPEIEHANLKVYPNPFSDRLRFEFDSPESVNARIDLYDMTGRLVKTIFEQPVEGGVRYEAEFRPETIISGIYIYRMVIGEAVYNGKVVFKKE
jgi:predicted glutamine amidotransferase